jgi:hypothetical protein
VPEPLELVRLALIRGILAQSDRVSRDISFHANAGHYNQLWDMPTDGPIVNDDYIDEKMGIRKTEVKLAGGEPVTPRTGHFTSAVRAPTRRPVLARKLADILGLTAWRDQRQLLAAVAEGAAAFTAATVDEEGVVDVVPEVGFWESLRQRVDVRLAERKHNVRHRASNRFGKRVVIVKKLVATLKFETHGFDNSINDQKALMIAAKGVVERAVKEGSLGIRPEESNWYKVACVALYRARDEDDELLEKLGGFMAVPRK